MSRSRPFQKNTAFGRFRVVVQELVTGIYFLQALFSKLFGQNVGATWLYTRAQFYFYTCTYTCTYVHMYIHTCTYMYMSCTSQQNTNNWQS